MRAIQKPWLSIPFGAIFLVAAVIALQGALPSWPFGEGTPSEEKARPDFGGEIATVERIVDGDTIVVKRDGQLEPERVRLIGIDTPELGHGDGPDECFAAEARALLEGLLPVGVEVSLRPDPTQLQSDKYGRLLRHVDVPATNTNVVLALLEAGAGPEYTYDRPYAGHADYLAAEAVAKLQGAGYWNACQSNWSL